MNLTLHVWRQSGPTVTGRFEKYEAKDVSPNSSFLEMLDQVNDGLVGTGKAPIAFDHDCREGICGMCGVMVNGQAHGPVPGTTACQVHMRDYENLGITELWIEPWRAKAFPVIRDLVVDRSSFDRVMQAGGFITVRTGSAPDGNAVPIGKPVADEAMDYAACIGCGACVASCPNASASLFVGAKVAHLGLLPQGQPERYARVQNMVTTMDDEGFGACTSHAECEAVCPKEIPIRVIALMNRDYAKGVVVNPVG
ncbi:MAG: succinate dehydrogenase / fumarate reductase iron-sulfur subunit [Myxococcota bacterium]|jgi:succinate dehydrogenase / fumarate reductase iron-sulfur subunit